MKILKYKKLSNNKYKVFLENSDSVVLHENIIINHNLLIKKEISDLDILLKENDKYLIYDNVLKYINTKMRCESEIWQYLTKKEIEEDDISNIINKLKTNGLINDEMYAKCFISDKIRLNKIGPNKIKKDLLNLKIDTEIIDNELSNINEEDINNNLEYLIDKEIKTNKNYAGNILKQKIINNLVSKGYSVENIKNILENKDLTNDDLYQKEYDKLYKKYSKKYTSDELDYFIKQKLYQKGFKKNNG